MAVLIASREGEKKSQITGKIFCFGGKDWIERLVGYRIERSSNQAIGDEGEAKGGSLYPGGLASKGFFTWKRGGVEIK